MALLILNPRCRFESAEVSTIFEGSGGDWMTLAGGDLMGMLLDLLWSGSAKQGYQLL